MIVLWREIKYWNCEGANYSFFIKSRRVGCCVVRISWSHCWFTSLSHIRRDYCCTWSWDAPTLNLLLEQEQVKIVDLQSASARVFLYLSSWYLDLAPPPGREVPETQHWISQRTKIRRLPPNQIRPFLFLPADHLLQFNLIEAFHRLLIEFGVKVAVSFLKVLAPILWNYCLPANLLPIRGWAKFLQIIYLSELQLFLLPLPPLPP